MIQKKGAKERVIEESSGPFDQIFGSRGRLLHFPLFALYLLFSDKIIRNF